MCYLTIFTPTYNRAYCLKKAYDSLKKQTINDFEWLIIDDGSSDETKQLINQFQNENNQFSIRYYYQKNSGKHIAINNAVKLAKGKLFLILDSDDYLSNDAVEWIKESEEQISDKKHYGGIVGCRLNFNGCLIGSTFDDCNYKDITFLERADNNITGDKAEVFYTDLLKKYPFPIIKDEKFCTEAVVWNRIAQDGWIFRYFNKGIYHCEYLSDGLTKNFRKLFMNSPTYSYMYIKSLLDSYPFMNFKEKNKNLTLAVLYAKRANIEKKIIIKELKINYLQYIFYSFIGLLRNIYRGFYL